MKIINKTPIAGHVYAVHTGTYAGQMLLYVEKKSVDYCFLSVPEMNNLTIPQTIFEHGIDNNIVKYVETVPKYVLKVSIAQYKHNNLTKHISKLKQDIDKVEE